MLRLYDREVEGKVEVVDWSGRVEWYNSVALML